MSKKDQIMNFCNQLKSGKIEIEDNIIDLSRCRKQVWIVVREMPVNEMISFYLKRFEAHFRENDVSDMLMRTS